MLRMKSVAYGNSSHKFPKDRFKSLRKKYKFSFLAVEKKWRFVNRTEKGETIHASLIFKEDG